MNQAKSIINITDIQRKSKINQRLVRYIVKNSLNKLYCGSYEINIIFCSENYIKKLNKTYRNQNKATDVLSFEIKEWVKGVYHIGEIYISPSVAQKNYLKNREFWEKFEWISRNADNYGHKDDGKENPALYYYLKGFRREIALLIIHGILHLFGYVHDEEHELNLDDENYDKDMKDMQNFLYKELSGEL
ncbi:MAG: rRNA maturation RNase YbeY [Candidatus Acidulodesulfobacterium sp.]